MDITKVIQQIAEVEGSIWSVWFLAGAALVFWMQAGFAMVEAGFTRAKNTGNIIMKNLMDFCIGTVMWFLIGASFMLSYTDPTTGEVSKGIWSIIGKPNFSVFTQYATFDFSNFVFNLVFCATTATIVSGAMAERTKFSSYCVYSAIISAVIYPIEAHWVWGGGFLAQWGFHDYAGSNCIHMVGGICALIGAWMEGPRIGKFIRNKAGKITKVNAFPGHNITIGALGVFILWLGWYGFNGAAATDISTLGSVFLTTTVAPAVATVTTMIFTWIKYGKPDVSMCLNASLAGLVAITAPCDVTDCAGAAVIGVVAGLLVVFGVWFLDHKLHIDDPVGAVAVHMLNGIWGTIAVGLFATRTAPGFSLAGIKEGLFYGGGFEQLGKQLGGMGVTIVWTVVTITLTFLVIKKLMGLRVTKEEEIIGLDKLEHGLDSSYAGFAISYSSEELAEAKEYGVKIPGAESQLVPATRPASSDALMHKVVIITRQNKFDELKDAMNSIGITGMTVVNVMGCGMQKGKSEYYRGVPVEINLVPKIKVEIVVSKVPVETVVETAKKSLYTGHIGDGKIFVYPVDSVVKVRTGESGYDALQDEEE
ncbi:MAG: ammonium transporter [Treponema sp.]|nr:ammonium transporter [Treponema sp.]MBQ2551843.1 ammonium transporter [Treponema sp.]MBQ4237476.1 ammonium transporter [Treponema sp.]MBQ5383054.1 ammonium transporter [Treponema sp.]